MTDCDELRLRYEAAVRLRRDADHVMTRSAESSDEGVVPTDFAQTEHLDREVAAAKAAWDACLAGS